MFELNIRFTAPLLDQQMRDKTKLRRFLEQHGVNDFVDAFIDGITDRADAITHEQLLQSETLDHWPITLYREQRADLEQIAALIAAKLAVTIQTSMRELPDELWQNAWFREGDIITWETGPLAFFCTATTEHLPEKPDLTKSLYIVSNQAFGDGRHHATTTMLEALIKFLTEKKHIQHEKLLDIGTGTGIVALAALKLGIAMATGTDISPDIIATAKANAARNHLPCHLAEEPDPLNVPGEFSIVCANILAPVLHDLMPAFAKKLSRGGKLFLSGFTISDAEDLITKASAAGLSYENRIVECGWVCLQLEKS